MKTHHSKSTSMPVFTRYTKGIFKLNTWLSQYDTPDWTDSLNLLNNIYFFPSETEEQLHEKRINEIKFMLAYAKGTKKPESTK